MLHDEPPQMLTMSLIERCTCGSGSFTQAADERASDLLKVEVIRLDWQRIATIQNLEIFTHLRELYLQHNRIEVIEELDTLRSLEFLALGSNRIRRLENLRHLSKLQVLDLSNNAIEDVDTQELPHALVILNLAGNACCSEPDYRHRVSCSLSKLRALDGEPVEGWSQTAGVEECKGPIDGTARSLEDENEVKEREPLTLYVTVHSGGQAKVVPFHFSPVGDLAQLAGHFCSKNGLHGDGPKETLVNQMEEAIAEPGAQAPSLSGETGFPDEATAGEEIARETTQEDANLYALPETSNRLHAILRLQRARARVMQESTASFEEHKMHLLAATRKLVKRKTASAHGRSNALENDINKILGDARAELQHRRARVEAENRQFATDMREKVERVLAERRRETQAAGGSAAVASQSHSA